MRISLITQQVSIAERPHLIDELFEALQAHLMDDARSLIGNVKDGDPVLEMANKVAEMRKDYKENYA